MPERKISDMSYDEIVARTEELRPQVDSMITELFQLNCAAARIEGACLPDQMMLAEYMIVCGWQAFNERGQRQGDVRLLLRDGSVPLYIARGMLSSAVEWVETNSWSGCNHEEDDDGSE